MDTKLVVRIRQGMESKSTNELQQLFDNKDKYQHTDEKLEAIRQLLEERKEFRKQNEPRVDNEKGGFFSFRTMISKDLVKCMYMLGLIGFTISGIIMILQAIQNNYGAGAKVLAGLALIIFGNLLWRIFCESCILLFSIHDLLGSIERNLKYKD